MGLPLLVCKKICWPQNFASRIRKLTRIHREQGMRYDGIGMGGPFGGLVMLGLAVFGLFILAAGAIIFVGVLVWEIKKGN